MRYFDYKNDVTNIVYLQIFLRFFLFMERHPGSECVPWHPNIDLCLGTMALGLCLVYILPPRIMDILNSVQPPPGAVVNF